MPTNEGVLGEIALSSLPRIEQIFVNAPAGWRPRDMERRLFIARRRIEKTSAEKTKISTFVACPIWSTSIRSVYAGGFALLLPGPRGPAPGVGYLPVPPALLHQHRYHAGRWRSRFRYLAHNGEINTITGNRQWARAPVPISSRPR
ncbi:hypothetical protein LNP74_09440 [Klebsiella pneumoniae subsp. pneumoniae]|nr:hypothetical protein [Klebsiella pneumoniae subsp. pneumoniae]